jgi:hypothetical protein
MLKIGAREKTSWSLKREEGAWFTFPPSSFDAAMSTIKRRLMSTIKWRFFGSAAWVVASLKE